MDRSVLESDPHRVLEGMAIAAYAVGATEGYVYCRAEYPLAVEPAAQGDPRGRREPATSGAAIVDTEFAFDVEVRLGAGAFVCGEETALIASIEGGRGTPAPRPPYPGRRRACGASPTLINNVETFANVAPIIRNGGDWFAGIGTAHEQGHQGLRARRPGRQHRASSRCPMGTTLREIVFDIGGGIVDGRAFKAVQTGGPSGGCIPAQFLDMPVDYESLVGVGSFMGSGGMIVMDDTSCMVDVAKYFMDFCREESCGKCVPCRVGTTQLYMLLDQITSGEATMDDLAQMERLADDGPADEPLRPRPGRAQPDLQHAALLPRRVPRPHRRPRLPGRRLHDRARRRCRHDASTRSGSTASTSPAPRARSILDGGRRRTASTSRRCATSTACPTSAPAACAWSRSPARTSSPPACTTPVAEGMEVTTDSEQLAEYRRTIIEMLFVERNHVCAVCVANNHCELQDLAEELRRRPLRAAA